MATSLDKYQQALRAEEAPKPPARPRTVGFLRELLTPVQIPAGAIVEIHPEDLANLRERGGTEWLCDLTLTPLAIFLSHAFNIPRMQDKPESSVTMVPCPACAHIPPSRGFSLCELCHDHRRVVVEMRITQMQYARAMQPFVEMCRKLAGVRPRA